MTDHFQKTAPGMMILFMHLEMLGEEIDALGEHRNLHLRRAGVTLVDAVFLDDRLFFFF